MRLGGIVRATHLRSLILRSRAQRGVSKDGSEQGMRNLMRERCLWPSFETRQSKSAVADFDTLVAEVRRA
jgi:hypothetical protein